MNTELTIINMFFKDTPFIVFDVGAHNFSFGSTICDKHTKAVAYGFEADIVTYEKCKHRFNNSTTKKYCYTAISDIDGNATFYPSIDFVRENLNKPHRDSGSICVPVTDENGRGIDRHLGLGFDMRGVDVPAIRIDTYCNNNNILHIDYMHIDVQGAEDKVIRSLGEIRPSFIFAETNCFGNKLYKTTTDLVDFDKLMFSKNYSIIDRDHSDTLYVHKAFNIKTETNNQDL